MFLVFSTTAQLVNRVRADLWANKVAQAPRQLPQSKKIINVLPISGVPRAFLVQTEKEPPIWKWLSMDGSSSSSSSTAKGSTVLAAPVDLLSVLLPTLPALHTRLGAVSAVVVHKVESGPKEANVILASLTVGTLHGFVATFYLRSWGGSAVNDTQWLLTALYRHPTEDQSIDAQYAPKVADGAAIIGLWANDEVIVSLSEQRQCSFWSRLTAADTVQAAATTTTTKLLYGGSRDGSVQIMMGKLKNSWCAHSEPFESRAQRTGGTQDPVLLQAQVDADRQPHNPCTLIRANKIKPESLPILAIPPLLPNCVTQVVFSLNGAVAVWAYHCSRSSSDAKFEATVQLSPPQVLSAVGGSAPPDTLCKILQVKLLDEPLGTIRPGLACREKLLTLLQFSDPKVRGARAADPLVLALWQLEYSSQGPVAPRLLMATPLGTALRPEALTFDVGPAAHIHAFLKSTMAFVALPTKLVLVALSNGQIIDVWKSGSSDPARSTSPEASRVTAVGCREDLGVIIVATGDLRLRLFSAETGGLPMRTIDLNASAAASTWVSSTRMTLRVIQPFDAHVFVALDPHCIYVRQIQKY